MTSPRAIIGIPSKRTSRDMITAHELRPLVIPKGRGAPSPTALKATPRERRGCMDVGPSHFLSPASCPPTRAGLY